MNYPAILTLKVGLPGMDPNIGPTTSQTKAGRRVLLGYGREGHKDVTQRSGGGREGNNQEIIANKEL